MVFQLWLREWGGNPELVEDGVTGMLVPPSNPVAMAQAIRMYLVDSTLKTNHSKAGRKKVEDRFSMQKMVNNYLAVYDTVLKGKGR